MRFHPSVSTKMEFEISSRDNREESHLPPAVHGRHCSEHVSDVHFVKSPRFDHQKAIHNSAAMLESPNASQRLLRRQTKETRVVDEWPATPEQLFQEDTGPDRRCTERFD